MRTIALLLLAWVTGGCVETGEVLGPALDGEAGSGTGVALAANAVTAGEGHVCGLFSGQLACWGRNDQGQLGLGDLDARQTPVFVDFDNSIRQVSPGAGHTCALDDLGLVFCWGGNERGQIGIGTREPSLRPAEVPLTARAAVLASGFSHSCAILMDASLWCWGQNSEGELGQGDPTPARNEEARRATDGLSARVVPGEWRSVVTGQGHTCGIRWDGSLWCWGRNSRYELGTEPVGQVREPVRVGDGTDWTAIDAGQHHTCGLRRDQSLWCWGENTASENDLGFPLGIDAELVMVPTRVAFGPWREIVVHTFHSCALDSAFDLYCWGRNVEGQLGLGDLVLRKSPTRVGENFARLALGAFFTCAVRRDGRSVCTGKNDFGQLGNGTLMRTAVFGEVTLLAQ